MLVYFRNGSAQTILRAATLRYKLQIKLSTSPSDSILVGKGMDSGGEGKGRDRGGERNGVGEWGGGRGWRAKPTIKIG